MKTTRYRIVVAYDGTVYQGWQRQPDVITVVFVLEKAFARVFGHTINILGASRTDAGVHACGQVASFTIPAYIPPEKIKFAWNNVLPDDVVIRQVDEAPLSFSPMHDVQSKTYLYHFFIARPLPFIGRYGWHVHRPVDLEKLQEVFKVFIGTHDFRSFCTGYDMPDTIRTIHSIELEYVPVMQAYRIIFKGPGFLRYMIRRIVGACLTIASKQELSAQDAKAVLLAKNPEHTLCNAPAKGLVLYAIKYNNSTQKDDEDVPPFFFTKT